MLNPGGGGGIGALKFEISVSSKDDTMIVLLDREANNGVVAFQCNDRKRSRMRRKDTIDEGVHRDSEHGFHPAPGT